MHWHYSHKMPAGRLVRFGVWEDSVFTGAVIFGRGLGTPLGLQQTEVCELVRVALTNHKASVTEIVATSLAHLHRQSPGMRLVISYADPNFGHLGIIYQAGNWIYTGTTARTLEVRFEGQWIHDRNMRPSGWGTVPKAARLSKSDQNLLLRRILIGKHRYAYPLDRAMRRRLQPLALPYPRGSSLDGETTDLRLGRPGSTPGNRSK